MDVRTCVSDTRPQKNLVEPANILIIPVGVKPVMRGWTEIKPS
jgi:hypothetical protein